MKKSVLFTALLCICADIPTFTAFADNFHDFDMNGRFDPVDIMLIMDYYADASTLSPDETIDDIDWDKKKYTSFYFDDNIFNGFLKNYETTKENNLLCVDIEINNSILENVKKYGDVNGDGVINSSDSAELSVKYYYGFDMGDINIDGYIDSNDASYVLEYYACKSTNQSLSKDVEEAVKHYGDMNGDSIIDATDASLILEKYAELSVS